MDQPGASTDTLTEEAPLREPRLQLPIKQEVAHYD